MGEKLKLIYYAIEDYFIESKGGSRKEVYSVDEKSRIKIRSIFRRRPVTRDTFSYLCYISSREDVSSRKASAEEIAEKIGASRTSVLGALRGISTGYKKDESLEYFGLVTHEKTVNQNSVCLYSVTPLGLQEKGLAVNYADELDKTNVEPAEPGIEEE